MNLLVNGKPVNNKNYLSVCIMITFLMLSGICETNSQTKPTERDQKSTKRIRRPIFTSALEANGKKDYKLAAELGAKSAVTEGKDDIAYLSFIHWWTSRMFSFAGNAEKCFTHLEKAIAFGYGADGEFLGLTRDPALRILYEHPKWKELLESSRNNFLKEVRIKGDSLDVQLLYEDDQSERSWTQNLINEKPEDRSKIMINLFRNDKKRQKEMRRLIEAGMLKTPNDFRSASFVFQHSADLKNISLAKEMAKRGYDLAIDKKQKCRLGWILAATTDRLLWLQRKPQIYGTQSRPANMTFEESVDFMEKIDKASRTGKDISKMIQSFKSNSKLSKEPFDRKRITAKEREMLCLRPVKTN